MALFGHFGKKPQKDTGVQEAAQSVPAPAPIAGDDATVIESDIPAGELMGDYIDDPEKLDFIITKEIISKQSDGI